MHNPPVEWRCLQFGCSPSWHAGSQVEPSGAIGAVSLAALTPRVPAWIGTPEGWNPRRAEWWVEVALMLRARALAIGARRRQAVAATH